MIHMPEKLENRITLGKIDVQLTETKWRPEKGKQLVPKSKVDKNPAVTNTGKNEAWVFLRVQIPSKKMVLVDPVSRKKREAAKTELFSFKADASWELIEREEHESETIYTYGYRSILPPGQTTTALFESVTLVNYLEGELDEEEELFIPVETMAIQTNVCDPGAGLQTVYQQYLQQKMKE